jgi:hypothetical protein
MINGIPITNILPVEDVLSPGMKESLHHLQETIDEEQAYINNVNAILQNCPQRSKHLGLLYLLFGKRITRISQPMVMTLMWS